MGALKGLAPAKIGQLVASQIKSLAASNIADLTASQLAGLTASQLALFSAGQLAALSKTQIAALSIPALGGLTPTQISSLSAAQVSGLTTAQIAALSVAQIGGLTTADIAALSAMQVAALTPAQIAALKLAQFTGLSATDLAAMSLTQIKALTVGQLAALTIAQLSGLSAADIAALSASQFANMSTKDIAALTSTQLKALTSAQVAALTSAQLGALRATQVGLLTLTALSGLTPAQIGALTAAQLAGLTANQFNALSGAQIGGLTTADIRALSTTQIASLSGAQIAGLSASQIGALSPAQLGSLTINYNSLLTLLQADATGGMTAGKFSALQALAGKLNVPGGISVPAYVQQIFDNVVLGNAANASWMGGTSHAVGLGNLNAASSQTQAGELIGKWFLGTDLPSSSVTMSGVPNFNVYYSDVSNPLFGGGGPSMSDINQGYLGDCFVLAPLAEMANQDPSAIQSMITANGNNTYSVRFTVNGKDDYVTVNNKLADGGAIFNHAANNWAGLIEKAYTQLQAGGAVTGDNFTYGNSYSSIGNGGYPDAILEEITGAPTITDLAANGSTWSSYSYNGPSLSVPNRPNSVILQSSQDGLPEATVQAMLIADLSAGDDLILSSYTDAVDNGGKTTLVADHAMAVYGFDTGTGKFQVYNPWGTYNGGGQYWDTSFEIGLPALQTAGDVISVATNANPLPLSPAVTPLLGSPQPLANTLGLAVA